MPTIINETEYPYERYVDGILQISIDGHNWTDYPRYTVPRHGIYQVASQITAPYFDNWAQSILNEIYQITGIKEDKPSNLSPFQEWERSING